MQENVIGSVININSIAINLTPYVPPWLLKLDGFELSVHLLGNKSEVSPTVFLSKSGEHLCQYDGYI